MTTTSRQEGFDARKRDESVTSCPYDQAREAEAWRLWMLGWIDAQRVFEHKAGE